MAVVAAVATVCALPACRQPDRAAAEQSASAPAPRYSAPRQQSIRSRSAAINTAAPRYQTPRSAAQQYPNRAPPQYQRGRSAQQYPGSQRQQAQYPGSDGAQQQYRPPANERPQFQRPAQNPYAPQTGVRGVAPTSELQRSRLYGRRDVSGYSAAALCASGTSWRVAEYASQCSGAATAADAAQRSELSPDCRRANSSG